MINSWGGVRTRRSASERCTKDVVRRYMCPQVSRFEYFFRKGFLFITAVVHFG